MGKAVDSWGQSATAAEPLAAAVDRAIGRTREYLLARQSPRGYWVGELEADASVAAGYLPLMYFMRGHLDPERTRKVANQVISKQDPDGSWSSYAGGPGDLSVSIQAYLALKLAGLPANEPLMRRARDFILYRGGIGKANVMTKIWLALFGQFDWRGVPTVPPEIVLLPNWFPLNIYDLGSWSRATVVALTIVLTQRPVCRLPAWARVGELYLEPEGHRVYPVARARPFSWERLFLALDALCKLWERLPVKPGRQLALRRAARWIEEHQEIDGSWGGIMLPWIYSLMALKSLGYPLDHPVISLGLAGLEGFIVEDAYTLRLQPAVSPVWDTAWAVLALRESGLEATHPALRTAATWLLDQEVRVAGDWRVKNPTAKPGCWAFELENDLYPDVDDTALVARALHRVQLPEAGEKAKAAAIARGLAWTLAMQSRDGGWAAFDRDNNKRILTHIPFADFMSPLDPTCADVTAHVVELLAELEYNGPALTRALHYLERTQEDNGSWYGRWGVNYLYGTSLALTALAVAGRAQGEGRIQEAISWLLSRQNADGGWGESCQSYEERAPTGVGVSTPSQTAWVLMGLIAAGEAANPAVRAGIQYLLRIQEEDGSWNENCFTGTGFPRAFYLRYDLYRVYFPLLALARYRAAWQEAY